MTLTPANLELLALWRARYAGLLAEAVADVESKVAEHARAAAAIAAAEAPLELQATFDATYKVLGSDLAQDLSHLQAAAIEARRQVSQTKCALESARTVLEDRRRSLAQADHVLAANQQEKAA